MRLFDAEALLLDVVDLQERDRIVTFLTADNGKKRGVARGARTKFSRFAGRLQPLAKVRLRWAEKPGRDLVRIGEVDLIRPAADLQTELEGILVGSYLAEHFVEFAQEDEPSGPLFRLLDSTLEALLAGADRWLAARYVETWILRLAGIFPVPRGCPLCDRPLERQAVLLESEGALVCTECGSGGAAGGHVRFVGREELDFLRATGNTALGNLEQPSDAVLDRVEDLCARVRRQFLQHELKSYHVLRQTLARSGSTTGRRTR